MVHLSSSGHWAVSYLPLPIRIPFPHLGTTPYSYCMWNVAERHNHKDVLKPFVPISKQQDFKIMVLVAASCIFVSLFLRRNIFTHPNLLEMTHRVSHPTRLLGGSMARSLLKQGYNSTVWWWCATVYLFPHGHCKCSSLLWKKAGMILQPDFLPFQFTHIEVWIL